MKVSMNWLREYVAIPQDQTGRQVAEKLVAAGLEVETVNALDEGLSGPIVVGRVEQITELTEFKKPIRHCLVSVGEDEPRSIVCGARNFAVGDLVVVSLPGAVLPGDFAIASRQTYGHLSDGMICSQRELGLGQEHDGIMVLPADAGLHPGQNALEVLGLHDEVLDIAVTPDRSYCLSVRGVAREAAAAYGVAFADPASELSQVLPGQGYPVQVEDSQACPLFVAVQVRGVDPSVASPLALQARVRSAGMRPISLMVDVTNVVMMELGQPLHAYDQAALRGPIGVRRAQPGEKVVTLDEVVRECDPDDLLITDDSGPIGLAGVMGGQTTEISAATTDIVLEAAHFAPAVIARSARRHKLPSEASRRFERGVDSVLPLVAAARAAALITQYAGGSVQAQATVVGAPLSPHPIALPADLPDRLAGHRYGLARVQELLELVGCQVRPARQGSFAVTPPTWRPDLTDPADLVEEVARLEGYDAIEPVLPQAPAGRGLTLAQRQRRQVLATLVEAGFTETPCFPFVSSQSDDALMLEADDPRRAHLQVSNPLSREVPLLRTSLLPGLFAAVSLNRGRGLNDLALAEVGPVFLTGQRGQLPALPQLGVDRRPTDAQVAQLYAAVPPQPQHVAVVLCGQATRQGWWGPGRAVSYADAIETMRRVAGDVGVPVVARAAQHAPWHPGRCAELLAQADTDAPVVLGYAGQLHPRVIAEFDLPEGTCAGEINLDVLLELASRRRLDQHALAGASLSNYPAVYQDLAVTVRDSVPAAAVEQALRAGAGDLLEHLRLFDVYTGDQIPAGHKSLTFALRLRAPDRTLTAEEAATIRQAALTQAAQEAGAVLRG